MIAYAGFTRPPVPPVIELGEPKHYVFKNFPEASALPEISDCICGAQGFLVCRSMTSILDGSIVDLYTVECQKGCNKPVATNFLEAADAIKSWNALVKNNHP